ncbi:MAG: hypothetical protein RIQ81_2091 [Pseudomonadota bacterium]
MSNNRKGPVLLAGALLVFSITTSPSSGAEGYQASGSAKDKNISEVESILERLEKKLTDNESGGLTVDERMKPAARDNAIPQAGKSLKFSRDAGSDTPRGNGGDSDSSAMLQELSAAVASLETKVERLHADIQKARLKVIEEARVDNFINIDAEFRGLERATVKSLAVSIDGVEVYKTTQAGGVWMPSNKVPLYAGPIPPGAHKLSVDATLTVKDNPAGPLASDVTRRVAREFEFSVPDGKERRQMQVIVDAPTKPDSKGSISLTGAGEVKL